GRDWSAAIILEITDARLPQGFTSELPYGNRSSIRVTVMRTCDRFEEQLKVAHGARHRSNDAEQCERTNGCRKVPCRRNAARRGFEPADPTERSGNSNRAASIPPDSSGGTAGRDRRGLSATGAAGGAFKIPRTVRSSIEGAVCFPRH